MIEYISEGIQTVLGWTKDIWNAIPDDLKPLTSASAIIGLAIAITKTIIKIKRKYF